MATTSQSDKLGAAFVARFFEIYNRQPVGAFQGVDDGERNLEALIANTDFGDEKEVLEFVDQLEMSTRSSVNGDDEVDPDRLVRKDYAVEDLYDLLYGLQYIGPSYEL